MVRWVVGSILHGGTIQLFLVPANVPRLVCTIPPLLLIGGSSPCSGGSGFLLLLSEWSFTICPTPYNRIKNVLSASLNTTFRSVFADVCGVYFVHRSYFVFLICHFSLIS